LNAGARLVGQLVRRRAEHELEVAEDRGQRRAQLVGGGGDEVALQLGERLDSRLWVSSSVSGGHLRAHEGGQQHRQQGAADEHEQRLAVRGAPAERWQRGVADRPRPAGDLDADRDCASGSVRPVVAASSRAGSARRPSNSSTRTAWARGVAMPSTKSCARKRAASQPRRAARRWATPNAGASRR
jgi:hypothetical protein